MKEKTVEKKPLLARFMDGVETVCNKLPPPTMLFVFLFFIVAILGTIFTFLGTSLTNPATGEIGMSTNFKRRPSLVPGQYGEKFHRLRPPWSCAYHDHRHRYL